MKTILIWLKTFMWVNQLCIIFLLSVNFVRCHSIMTAALFWSLHQHIFFHEIEINLTFSYFVFITIISEQWCFVSTNMYLYFFSRKAKMVQSYTNTSSHISLSVPSPSKFPIIKKRLIRSPSNVKPVKMQCSRAPLGTLHVHSPVQLKSFGEVTSFGGNQAIN